MATPTFSIGTIVKIRPHLLESGWFIAPDFTDEMRWEIHSYDYDCGYYIARLVGEKNIGLDTFRAHEIELA